jgi:hypothetical protein
MEESMCEPQDPKEQQALLEAKGRWVEALPLPNKAAARFYLSG